MTRPGFLDDSRVRCWLRDVEAARTALTYDSFNALQQEPSSTNTALRLVSDLTVNELNASAVARNAVHLLHHVARGGGLKLTARDNPARAVVADMIDFFDWPNFDKVDLFRLNRVINEPDFLPLHFVRLVAEAARLVRHYGGLRLPVAPATESDHRITPMSRFLKPTVPGRDLSKEPQRRALLAILF
jgi:hypothetical protein